MHYEIKNMVTSCPTCNKYQAMNYKEPLLNTQCT